MTTDSTPTAPLVPSPEEFVEGQVAEWRSYAERQRNRAGELRALADTALLHAARYDGVADGLEQMLATVKRVRSEEGKD